MRGLREEITFEKTSIFHEKSSQNRTKKSRKTAYAAKIDKNALLGAPFFAQSRFSIDFGGPAWSHFDPKSAKKAEGGQHFWVTKTRADDGSVPRALPEASRSHSGGSEDPPEAIFERIFDDSSVTISSKS